MGRLLFFGFFIWLMMGTIGELQSGGLIVFFMMFMMWRFMSPPRGNRRNVQRGRYRHVRVPNRDAPPQSVFDDDPFYDEGEIPHKRPNVPPTMPYDDASEEQYLRAPDGKDLRIIHRDEETD